MDNVADIIAQGIVWLLVAVMGVAIAVVFLVAATVYFSVTWPWYLFRGMRRIARPR
jgi:hypothetical protein